MARKSKAIAYVSIGGLSRSLQPMQADRRWKPQPFLVGAPLFLRPWLTDSSSLTARIAARCGVLRVRVLRTGLARPTEDERRLVGLAPGHQAWAREVLLLADGQPVVFAHTVLAPRHLRGSWRMASGMGGRPLGAALFADPQIVRGALHCERLTAAHPLHRRAAAALGETLPVLWGRRSCFLRDGHPLLVTEVFLPGIARLG
ncbi:MAG: chorismate lyase [Rhodocyclaceae bacterium]|nr:chorismate lyase [Rhodocyclaceae bacterium]